MTDCKCPLCESGYPVSNLSTFHEFQQRVIQKALEQSSKHHIIEPMPDMIIDGKMYDFKTERERDFRLKPNPGLALVVAGLTYSREISDSTYDQFVSRMYRQPRLDLEGSYKPVIWDFRPNPSLVDMEPLYLVPDLRSSTMLYRPLVDGLNYLQGDLWSIWTLTSKLPEDRFASYKRMYSLWSAHFASYYMPMEMEVRSFGNGLGLLQVLGQYLGKTDTITEQVKTASKSFLDWKDGRIIDESPYVRGNVRNVEKDSKPFYQKKNEAHLAQNRFGTSFKS